jgi:hypothetical protein
MALLLDRMPFPDEASEIFVHNERVRIRADQIIVWVSLSLKPLGEPNPSVRPFPAILDTGHNHSFSIAERHLAEWAILRPERLAVLGSVRERGRRISLHSATIWAHPNERGSRERLSNRPPTRLQARKGIAVYPGSEFPRLPILGLRAIAETTSC